MPVELQPFFVDKDVTVLYRMLEKGTPADCKSAASIKKRGKGAKLADYLPGFCIKVVKLFLDSRFKWYNEPNYFILQVNIYNHRL